MYRGGRDYVCVYESIHTHRKSGMSNECWVLRRKLYKAGGLLQGILF